MNRGSIRFWFIPCKMKVPGMYGFQMSGAGMLTMDGTISWSLRATWLAGAVLGAAWAVVPRTGASINAKTPALSRAFALRGLAKDTRVLLGSLCAGALKQQRSRAGKQRPVGIAASGSYGPAWGRACRAG